MKTSLRSKFTKNQFEDLCRATADSYIGLVNQHLVGMKVLLVQSPEYRAICRSGKACRDLLLHLKSEARDRGYTEEQMKELFGKSFDLGCAFN